MARAPFTTDPAQDSGALLRRIGLAVLTIVLPVVALYSRRGVVLFLPVGVALLAIASALDGGFRPLRQSRERLASSTGVLAAVFGLSWATLSLAWTPSPLFSLDRLSGLLASVGLGLAAYLALPDRMRSANLYLTPIGTALAAVGVVATALAAPDLVEGDADGRSLERGLTVLTLLAWPSIAWLRSRNRDGEAVCLVLAVALATLIGPQSAISATFAAGALGYVAVALSPNWGLSAAKVVMPAIVLFAPILPFVVGPFAGTLAGGGAFGEELAAWRSLVASEPGRLLTGHGYGAFLLGRIAYSLPPGTPDTPLVHIWYDLGIVGALAIAATIWAGLRGAASSYTPLLPGIVGAVTAAFSLACAGVGSGQAWWPASLVVLALAFVAAQRGQVRTRRPRARDPSPT